MQQPNSPVDLFSSGQGPSGPPSKMLIQMPALVIECVERAFVVFAKRAQGTLVRRWPEARFPIS